MQFEGKCNSCQFDYDEELGIPFLLPCDHSICQACLISDFRRQNQNKCSICLKVSNVHPSKLLKNEQLIQKIKDKAYKQEQITNILESLHLHKSNLKQIMQKIIQSQSSFIFEVISLINKSLFPQQKQNFTEISSKVQEISKLINVLEYQKVRKNINLEVHEEQKTFLLFEDLKQLQLKGNQQIQTLEKQKEMSLFLIKQLNQISVDHEIEEFKQNVNKFVETLKISDQYSQIQNLYKEKVKYQENNFKFIHRFHASNLHLFDVKTEQYYKVNLEQESPSN